MNLEALRDGNFAMLGEAVTDWDQMVGKLKRLQARAENELDGKARKASWAGLNATVTREFVTKTAKEFEDAVSQARSVRNILRDVRQELISHRENLREELTRARKKGIEVIDTGGGKFLVTGQCRAGETPPTQTELDAVKDELTGILKKATESDDDAAKALRGLSNLSKLGFSDAPVIKDREHAVDSVNAAKIRQQGIELEKQYKKDTKWPYEWDENGEHPRWGDSDYTGKVGWAERDLMESRPLEGADYLSISKWASETAAEEKEKNPDIDENAFRHTIWQAKLTYSMGEEKAELWADAHEAYHPRTAHADHMADLVNNVHGRQLGRDTLDEVPYRPAGMAGPGSSPEAEDRILREARRYAQSDEFAHPKHFEGFDR
ncbi:DUF6973 domain-containing protein [Streptomyces albidus (ex Kaewkla and Franco 2022)]|uniref:DUF6973 domain-containing protein n=1 Tax=Streptomyces albidus (ex Kaewkla and Franco 2022) TaxID=722709 RepID=UPI0015EFA5A0|nr:hypothetical protein [Streptomyces albidus (ex Kaewkla and Franco 2022)]